MKVDQVKIWLEIPKNVKLNIEQVYIINSINYYFQGHETQVISVQSLS